MCPRLVAARVIFPWLAVCAVALAAPRTAHADDGFVWRAPAGCPAAAAVRARVEQRLGVPLEGAIHGIEIEITREGREFVAVVDARALTVANDIRTLRSARCDALADALAVILARLASEARRTEPTLLAVTTTTSTPRGVADPLANDTADAPEREVVATVRAGARASHGRAPVVGRWGGGVRALALSGVGALPRVNLGAELAGFVRREARFAELSIGRWVPQSARFDAGAPARVDVSMDVVTLRGGWNPGTLPIRAWLGIELGKMQGTGVAVLDPRSAAGRWIAVSGGFGVAWPMSPRARLVGTFEVAVPVERTRFMLDSGAELFQPAIGAARCALGLELGWP